MVATEAGNVLSGESANLGIALEFLYHGLYNGGAAPALCPEFTKTKFPPSAKRNTSRDKSELHHEALYLGCRSFLRYICFCSTRST